MSTTTVTSHGAQENTTILPHPVESFETIARYLRESAYGVYAETLSPDVMQASRVATLWLVAQGVQALDVGLSASRDDVGMSRMIETCHWLSARGRIQVGAPNAVALRSTDLDERTWRLGDLQTIPNRARVDAGSMREYVRRVAAQWAVQTSSRKLIGLLARSTGSMLWMRAASALEAGAR